MVSETMPVASEKSQTSKSSRPGLAAASVMALVLVAIAAAVGVAWLQERNPGRPAHFATASAPAPRSPPPPPIGSSSSSGALPLPGVRLRAPTNLRLLVADVPAPFVLDVDRRSVQPITGLPAGGDRGISVVAIGKAALVQSLRFCKRCQPDASVYLVKHGSTAATRLGRVMGAVSSSDGEGVWTISTGVASRCTIREIDLDGRVRRSAGKVPCRTGLIAELPAGLLLSFVGPLGMDAHSTLLEPSGQVVRLGDPNIQPVVGNLVLSGADRHTPLVLRDVRSGARHRLSWPSSRGYSLAEVTGDPNGHLAIVRFARFSPRHMLDMWLLDTQTRRWEHLRGMPAPLVPKATDVEWSADGRVVILSGHVLGVWRPGSPQLTVGRIRPTRQPGSNFVVW